MFNREKQELKRVPMMPVRDMVIFPQQMTPFIVGREASVRALEEALPATRRYSSPLSMTPLSMTPSQKKSTRSALSPISFRASSCPTAT